MAGTSAPQIPHCRDLTLVGERLARMLFTGHSERLGRAVTITVYPRLADAASRQRFDGAATTAQRLGAHPSVLTIHDWGHALDSRPWIVTDRIPAATVDTVLKSQGPLDVERALHIGVLVAGALQTAHRAGIVHGDLSPDRLVFGARGEALVAEIGLAEFGTFPGLGALNNPIRYHAPPEVLERTGVTPASDIYSLATTVYALLAGRAPHEKPADITDSNASLLLRILQIDVPAIERPDLPAGIDSVLRSGLAHSADKRPTKVIELAWALQDVQRRAGLATSEPVVLDLDGLTPGAAHLPTVPPTAEDPGPARPPLVRPPLAGWASTADDTGGVAPAAAGGPTLDPASVPPDLDALPAWYTDPLPNPPGSAPAGDPAHLASDTPPDLADRRFGPLGGIATPWPWGDGPAGTAAAPVSTAPPTRARTTGSGRRPSPAVRAQVAPTDRALGPTGMPQPGRLATATPRSRWGSITTWARSSGRRSTSRGSASRSARRTCCLAVRAVVPTIGRRRPHRRPRTIRGPRPGRSISHRQRCRRACRAATTSIGAPARPGTVRRPHDPPAARRRRRRPSRGPRPSSRRRIRRAAPARR